MYQLSLHISRCFLDREVSFECLTHNITQNLLIVSRAEFTHPVILAWRKHIASVIFSFSSSSPVTFSFFKVIALPPVVGAIEPI